MPIQPVYGSTSSQQPKVVPLQACADTEEGLRPPRINRKIDKNIVGITFGRSFINYSG
jgi:hypothetical protein